MSYKDDLHRMREEQAIEHGSLRAEVGRLRAENERSIAARETAEHGETQALCMVRPLEAELERLRAVVRAGDTLVRAVRYHGLDEFDYLGPEAAAWDAKRTLVTLPEDKEQGDDQL